MKRLNTFAIATAVLTASLGGHALAQPHGLTAFIAEFDTNKDDIVTHAASQDTDKDGKITINEPPKTETN